MKFSGAKYVVSYLQASKERKRREDSRKGLCANNHTGRKGKETKPLDRLGIERLLRLARHGFASTYEKRQQSCHSRLRVNRTPIEILPSERTKEFEERFFFAGFEPLKLSGYLPSFAAVAENGVEKRGGGTIVHKP